jgi:LysR family transcriptional regulator, glycine cleavage system transcriptional activator
MQIPFRAISVFHAVARSRSVSKAAVELGVTPSAVSQQVHALEEQLGSVLMMKVGSRIKLTSAGERYYEMIGVGIDRVVEATGVMKGYRAKSVLNIRATPTLSTKWLLPRLPRFLALHDHLDVRLNATSEPTDFTREDVDVAIRSGRGNWPGYTVEGFAEERFFPVCAPGYAKAASLSWSRLADCMLIESIKSAVQWSDWFRAVGIEPPRRRQRLLLDRSHMSVDAAAIGVGVALESTLYMSDQLAAGSLVCPVADPPNLKVTSQWIICPPDRMRYEKVRLFIDWLKKEREDWIETEQRQFGASTQRAGRQRNAQMR